MALAAVLLGVVMTSLDNTVVNVALPSIAGDLRAGIAGTAWVVDAYLLSFATLLLTGGRLADTFGRRRIFLIGAVLFTGASLLAALAFSLQMLIAARALQGAGAALLTPPTLAIITHVFRDKRGLDMALGIWGSIGAIAFAVGPLVGGALTQALSWRWALLINVPSGGLAIVLARRFVPESRDPEADRRLDVRGLFLAGVALFALTFALSRGHDYGWTSTAVVGPLLVAAASAIGFVRVERRAPTPLIDPSLLRGRFAAANIVTFAIGVAWFGAFLFTALFLQQARGASPVQAAIALLPWLLMILVVAPLTGVLVRYVPGRLVVVTGLVLLAIAFLQLSGTDETSSYLSMVPGMLLGGTGTALTIPLNGIALAAVAPAKAGVASGIFNTARETGGCVGVALTSAVAGYSDALLVAAILTLGAAVLTLIALRPERLESYAAQAWPSEWSTEWEIASMKAPTICVGEVMW
ncbi:MAG TPA: MFS transporter [Frankiaceae bacterium]|nr:MFS transporter [Frankiaceae bacterium]